METFGQRLKRLREERNLSPSDVSKKIKTAVSTYRDWELGREIKGEPYEELANTLHVSVSYLITGKESQAEQIIKEMESLLIRLRKCI